MMSNESLEQFRLLVLEDASLQVSLREADDVDSFVALMIRLGAERGFDFDGAEVREALRASRRAWRERWV